MHKYMYYEGMILTQQQYYAPIHSLRRKSPSINIQFTFHY